MTPEKHSAGTGGNGDNKKYEEEVAGRLRIPQEDARVMLERFAAVVEEMRVLKEDFQEFLKDQVPNREGEDARYVAWEHSIAQLERFAAQLLDEAAYDCTVFYREYMKAIRVLGEQAALLQYAIENAEDKESKVVQEARAQLARIEQLTATVNQLRKELEEHFPSL